MALIPWICHIKMDDLGLVNVLLTCTLFRRRFQLPRHERSGSTNLNVMFDAPSNPVYQRRLP